MSTASARRARRTPRTLRAAGAGVAVLLALSACSSSDDSDSAGSRRPPSGGSEKLSGTVTVFAAASLKESFTTLGKEFEKAHPARR